MQDMYQPYYMSQNYIGNISNISNIDGIGNMGDMDGKPIL